MLRASLISLWLAVLVTAGGCSSVSEPPPPGSEPPAPCETDEGELPNGPERSFLGRDADVEGQRERCSGVLHAAAGAIYSTLSIQLVGWDGESPARLRVLDLLGEVLAESGGVVSGDELPVTLDRSGEVLVQLVPEDPDEPSNSYSLRVECTEWCQLEYTRWPLVLMHGMGGTDEYLDVLAYFYGVADELTQRGYLVVTPAVDALGPPETRGPQWSEWLDQFVAEGLGRRFNLHGHSQGGIDARLVASALNDDGRIASVTTYASPHLGTAVADAVEGLLDEEELGDLVDDSVSALTELLGLGPAQVFEAIAGVSTPRMEVFNATYPDHPDVAYFSWTGRTCGITELDCQAEMEGELVPAYLVPTYRLLALVSGPNDGMLAVDSAAWGEFLGVVPADHLDEVGQIGGLTTTFDHLGFFLEEARRLAEQGL